MAELSEFERTVEEESVAYFKELFRNSPYSPLQCYLSGLNFFGHNIWVCVKYLGIHLESRFTWKDHVTKKRKQTYLKTKELNWLIGRRSNLSLENKVLLYKTINKPI
jgi:hypothetical protein